MLISDNIVFANTEAEAKTAGLTYVRDQQLNGMHGATLTTIRNKEKSIIGYTCMLTGRIWRIRCGTMGAPK